VQKFLQIGKETLKLISNITKLYNIYF